MDRRDCTPRDPAATAWNGEHEGGPGTVRASLSREPRVSMRVSRRARCTAWALGLSLVLPGAALAEGAVTVIDCAVTSVCDAQGSCEPASRRVSFRLEPLDRNADGSARYEISYGNNRRAEVRGLSDAGPYVWTTDKERNALLASSETRWLWHQLELDPAGPLATIRFLSCTIER